MASATDTLDLQFYLILINLHLNSRMCLGAAVLAMSEAATVYFEHLSFSRHEKDELR